MQVTPVDVDRVDCNYYKTICYKTTRHWPAARCSMAVHYFDGCLLYSLSYTTTTNHLKRNGRLVQAASVDVDRVYGTQSFQSLVDEGEGCGQRVGRGEPRRLQRHRLTSIILKRMWSGCCSLEAAVVVAVAIVVVVVVVAPVVASSGWGAASHGGSRGTG